MGKYNIPENVYNNLNKINFNLIVAGKTRYDYWHHINENLIKINEEQWRSEFFFNEVSVKSQITVYNPRAQKNQDM